MRWGQCKEKCSTMFQWWLRFCWKWSMCWKGGNKENTWECQTCVGCNQQRSATDRVRTRSWSGDSKNYCVLFCRRILAWNVSWQNSFHSFCCPEGGNMVPQLLMMLGEMCEVPRCLLWREMKQHCPMYNVSCIFFNKCLYFSHGMAGYLLDRHRVLWQNASQSI